MKNENIKSTEMTSALIAVFHRQSNGLRAAVWRAKNSVAAPMPTKKATWLKPFSRMT